MQPRGPITDRASHCAQPLCEQLEARLLMAASVRRGVLRVAGTPGNDDITIDITRTRIFVTLNGHSQTFNPKGIKLARIDGGLGDDWMGINGKLPGLLLGGAGADTITGGSAADFLDGGDGADLLNGGNGNDDISGEDGNDIISGGAGVDVCLGEAGDDDLDGGSGPDFLKGGPGND